MEGFIVKAKDQLKLEVVYKVISGQLSRCDGQRMLNISERTMRRYLKSYEVNGISFLRHGNFRREPANKTNKDLREKVQHLIQEKYFDFNVCHLQEKLFEELGIKIKYQTLRRWCHEIRHVKRPKKRRSKPRFYRERMSQEGLMLQMDGSHHVWFGGRRLCLLAAIDDATSEVFGKFYEGETTNACLDFLHELVRQKGIFKTLYTDKAGVYGGIKRENFSQVERALGELGAQVIYAHSPQAKGRIERLFGTFQDRLVAELRLNGIGTLESANEYLQKIYLPHIHNPKSMVLAQNPVSAYRPLPPDLDLGQTFCVKEYRIVAKDHTVSIGGDRWMIGDSIYQSISRQKIELRFDKWGVWTAYFANKKIKLVKIKRPQKTAA